MSQRAMEIKLMDRNYKINCPAGQEVALQRAADKLNHKLEQIRSNKRLTHAEQIAVMAALNLVHEGAQVEQQLRKQVEDLEEKLKLLQETLEQVMTEQGPKR